MKRTTITLFLSALLLGSSASAQVAKQVEVSKNYAPSISAAAKLPIEPNMVDTVTMRPEIDYTIVPRNFSSSLGTRRFNAATITYWEYSREYPFYVKVGAGYPFNSVVDAYASTARAGVGFLSAYVNHRGQYSKINNIYPRSWGGEQFKNNSVQLTNKAGVNAGKYFGRYTLSGDLFYRSEMYHRYPLQMPEFKRREVNFENVDFKVSFGDAFSDMGHLNFKVYAEADFFNDKSQNFVERAGYQQINAFGGVALSRKIGRNGIFRLSADYRGYFGLHDLSDYDNSIISATLRYAYATPRGLNVRAGLSYYRDIIRPGKDRNHFIPYLYIAYDSTGKGSFVPFVELDGAVENNGYYALVQRNPYVDILPYGDNMAALPNTVNHDVRFGVSGHSAGSKFAYRFYANMSFVENALYWYSINRIYFAADAARENIWSLSAEMDYKPLSQLYMSLLVKGFIYTTWSDYATARPPIEASFKIRYSHRKFAVGARADVLGKRTWTTILYPDFGDGVNTQRRNYALPAYVDLGLNVDWYVTPKCTLFAEGNNLANMNIYRYVFYREYGANFTVGVKLQF